MTNKEIRRRAWELCRENFGLILSATFLTSLISTLTMEVVSWMDAPLLTLIASIFLMILSGIMSIGMVRFILDIWHGETPTLSVLFSQKHRLGTFICYNLLTILLVLAVYLAAFIPLAIITSLVQAYTQLPVSIFVIICMVIATIPPLWLILRFEMAVTCMVIRHSYRATECMRTAWRTSKGNVWRLLCNEFILGLPLFLAQGLLTGYQTYLLMTGQMLNDIGFLLLDFGTVLISALLSGYIYLGTYPLHEQLLESYLASHPEKAAAETWTELPASDEEYEEIDEYEDIPEDEEDTDSPEP